MAKKKSRGRKTRVDFRQNRADRRRTDEWTRRYRANDHDLADEATTESVRAKGELSRKRTVILGEDDLTLVDESQWRQGVVTKVHGLISYVDASDGPVWECTVRRVLRTVLIERRSSVTVGDRVWFSDQSAYCDGDRVGVIERVEPRRSSLSRRDRRKREHTIVANAEQLLAVVSVLEPRLKPHLVDRYIVAAHKGDLQPILCFNKVDLLREDIAADTEEIAEADARVITIAEAIQEFRDLGYTCLCTSTVDGAGLDDLRAALSGKITVLSGQSGVGKSSLINAIQPHMQLSTQTVSNESQKGRHTTTHAQLLPLDFGGYVVDTPGIRSFDLWNVEPGELEAFFVEIAPLIDKCRFSDCSHRHEQDCAVIAAVEDGRISERRYFSYLKMFDEV